MNFEKGQLVYSGHTGKVLYEVLGYNGARGIILLPVGLENKMKNRKVFPTDSSIYEKKD